MLITSTPIKYLYDLRNGIFKNKASVNSTTNFVDKLGGIYNGYVSINIQVSETTLYDLKMQYLE